MKIDNIKTKGQAIEYLDLKIGDIRKDIYAGNPYIFEKIGNLDNDLARINGNLSINQKHYKSLITQLIVEKIKTLPNKDLALLEGWIKVRELSLDPDEYYYSTRSLTFKP